MKTGIKGTFVISWSQTEIDGFAGAPLETLDVGAVWAWRGDAMRVDGPNEVLRLDQANEAIDLRKRAARMVERLVGAQFECDRPQAQRDAQGIDGETPLMDRSFMITDGSQTYAVSVIETGRDMPPLLMFLDQIPPKNCDMWVVHHSIEPVHNDKLSESAGGVICFTPGTLLRTPQGEIAIEDLREGDRIDTLDSGPQEIQWIGSRRMSGARLFAMPKLRPVRIAAHFLGDDVPDGDLLVSPQHRILLRGAAAQDLFNTPEVLVCAKDLVNGSTVKVEHFIPDVTYIHVLLGEHQVVWANGVQTESFHPASAGLSNLRSTDRSRLLDKYPEIQGDPHIYGDFARRCLSSSEAALFLYAA